MTRAGGSLSEGARWALCGGVAVALASLAVIHFTATRAPRERDLGSCLASPAVRS